jgi:hypothetical protein
LLKTGDEEAELSVTVVEATKSQAAVETTLSYRGEVTDTCRGTFFAVKPGTRHIISVEKEEGNNSP